jgi:hypothetical protein
MKTENSKEGQWGIAVHYECGARWRVSGCIASCPPLWQTWQEAGLSGPMTYPTFKREL